MLWRAWWKDQGKVQWSTSMLTLTVNIDQIEKRQFWFLIKWNFFHFFKILSLWGTFGMNTSFRCLNAVCWQLTPVNVHFYCIFSSRPLCTLFAEQILVMQIFLFLPLFEVKKEKMGRKRRKNTNKCILTQSKSEMQYQCLGALSHHDWITQLIGNEI